MRSDPDVLLGASCLSCRRPGSIACNACLSRVPAAALRPIAGVDRALAPWSYEGAARRLVLHLKLGASRASVEPLVAGMSRELARSGTRMTAVVWVPARRRDIRRRGFDHAELLARGIARATGLPAVRALERLGHQADQAGLSRPERRVNLQGAFRARPSDHDGVVIVDDLLTTGATATACAHALRKVGHSKVELIAACVA